MSLTKSCQVVSDYVRMLWNSSNIYCVASMHEARIRLAPSEGVGPGRRGCQISEDTMQYVQRTRKNGQRGHCEFTRINFTCSPDTFWR